MADLDRPTPCEGWNLADLLGHMTVQHRGFAAAARGFGADPDVWRVETSSTRCGPIPVGTYAEAAHDVLDAFAADGTAEAPFALPEFGEGAVFPGAMAMGFHFVDYVVHGWDVAATLGVPFELPADVVERRAAAGARSARRRLPHRGGGAVRACRRARTARTTSNGSCAISAAGRTGAQR